MTSLSFNSWAASGSKTIHLYNETGAPLNFTMPNVYTYSLDGLSFNGSPFTFSNTVWNCELRDNKSMTFNTHTTFGSMVSTMQQTSSMLSIRFFIGFSPPVRVGSVCPPRLFSGFLCF